MEESYFLQASLDSSNSFSERRNAGEATMSPYYMKSMTPSAFEASLRQKEGELASYMSRLVWITFWAPHIQKFNSTLLIVFAMVLSIPYLSST